MSEVTKFMVTVETKNYPVISIRPTIQRYGKIRKKMNASEIAQCLAAYATVTLEKNNGTKVKLTSSNFKDVLKQYSLELTNNEIVTGMSKEEKRNAERLEKIKEPVEEVVETTNTRSAKKQDVTPVVEEEIIESEQTETVQNDPEDPDEFDSSAYYDDDKDTEEE